MCSRIPNKSTSLVICCCVWNSNRKGCCKGCFAISPMFPFWVTVLRANAPSRRSSFYLAVSLLRLSRLQDSRRFPLRPTASTDRCSAQSFVLKYRGLVWLQVRAVSVAILHLSPFSLENRLRPSSSAGYARARVCLETSVAGT